MVDYTKAILSWYLVDGVAAEGSFNLGGIRYIDDYLLLGGDYRIIFIIGQTVLMLFWWFHGYNI